MIEPTIGIGRYLIKEKLNEGLICMQFVSSNKQLAYVFTEGLIFVIKFTIMRIMRIMADKVYKWLIRLEQ